VYAGQKIDKPLAVVCQSFARQEPCQGFAFAIFMPIVLAWFLHAYAIFMPVLGKRLTKSLAWFLHVRLLLLGKRFTNALV
jgi:hypothetical protein